MDKALELMVLMADTDIPRDVYTYNAALHG